MDFLCCKKFIEYFEISTQVTLYLNNFKLGTKIELKCTKKQINTLVGQTRSWMTTFYVPSNLE